LLDLIDQINKLLLPSKQLRLQVSSEFTLQPNQICDKHLKKGLNLLLNNFNFDSEEILQNRTEILSNIDEDVDFKIDINI